MKRWYGEHVLPHLIEWSCRPDDVAAHRQRVVPFAAGQVLEIGVGTGLNLGFYNTDTVDRLWGVEPSDAMRSRATARGVEVGLEVEWIGRSGEQVPLGDAAVDTVVSTYTLCSIPDWDAALTEIRRVLAPDGVFVFCEHGAAPDEAVQRWQRRLNPMWRACAGGCNLDRPILAGLERNGFEIEWADQEYRGRPRCASFTTLGLAGR
ncbi:MAG: class I SAM-dependent methyltransferase [Actinomycetota bacterium]